MTPCLRVALILCLLPLSAWAETARLCERASVFAAQRTGVPLDVLRAISLTETGRRHQGQLRPWPWTVNMEGKGVWFDTPKEALDYAMAHHAKGARSFDVGCFQINYKWHGDQFTSIAQMFDPIESAMYAARLLRGLHLELGTWSKAAGAYHSRTPKFATRYRARFDQILAGLGGADVTIAELQGPGEIPDALPDSGVLEEPWVPPPATALGSVAGLSAVGARPPLLRPARRGLF